MDQRCRRKSVWENPAYLLASLYYMLDVQHQKKINVIMPYSDSLSDVGDWFCQLWAESLGKENKGQTPIRARGATDQHSQLQLYMDGPNDKIITFINVIKFLEEYPIPPTPEDLQDYCGVNYLGGHSLGKLLHTEHLATELALTHQGRANLTIHLPLLCSETLGQLIYLLEMQTAFAGLLYGVNPFDQPAVELGKKITYFMLGRSGFSKKPSELNVPEEKSQKFII
jgi:glucose-6-phosphate isomerase